MSPDSRLPQLNRNAPFPDEAAPDPVHFDLPEKILQFGTGAFLRGFVEYFVDEANRDGRLGSRIALVSSTGSGRARSLTSQDNLYTLATRGLESGREVDRVRVLPVISRAISARDDWASVLDVAASGDLRFIISNTTEVGITLDRDDTIDRSPPRSFPGKLTAVLYERARAYSFAEDAGLVILPCELIENNGAELRRIVLTLAAEWDLGDEFVAWLESANTFCNTLVDRIVPGTPGPAELDAMQKRLGYRDDMLTVAEPYRLWAIEATGVVKERLAPLAADPGVLLVEDISPYRTRKVRILNGGHTISVPAAWLCGCETVREAVEDPIVGEFLRHVVLDEIVPGLDLEGDMAKTFAADVLERFGNPFIRHELLDITFQQTMKLRVRVVPSLAAWYDRFDRVPESMAFGIAAFLVFQHPDHLPNDARLPVDDAREWWTDSWSGVDVDDEDDLHRFVHQVLSDADRWGRSLASLPGLADSVSAYVSDILHRGARETLQAQLEAVS